MDTLGRHSLFWELFFEDFTGAQRVLVALFEHFKAAERVLVAVF